MLSDTFADNFREEHRQVRDLLFALRDALNAGNLLETRRILESTAQATGPHFRYEEESLYPALIPVFGEAYVEKLLADHDRVIAGARELVRLAGRDRITRKEALDAMLLVQGMLPHVSDCDGLSIMVERLPEINVAAILKTRERCNREGVDLIRWAAELRQPRPQFKA